MAPEGTIVTGELTVAQLYGAITPEKFRNTDKCENDYYWQKFVPEAHHGN